MIWDKLLKTWRNDEPGEEPKTRLELIELDKPKPCTTCLHSDCYCLDCNCIKTITINPYP